MLYVCVDVISKITITSLRQSFAVVRRTARGKHEAGGTRSNSELDSHSIDKTHETDQDAGDRPPISPACNTDQNTVRKADRNKYGTRFTHSRQSATRTM